MKKENWLNYISIFIFAGALILLYNILNNFLYVTAAIAKFFTVISPFLFGILIVYFVYIPYKKFKNLYSKSKIKYVAKKAKGLSVLTIYSILLIIIAFIFKFLGPILFESISELIKQIPTYYGYLLDWVAKIPDNSAFADMNIKEGLESFYNNYLNKLLDPENFENYVSSIMGIFSSFLNILISIVFSIYILLEKESITDFFDKLGSAIFKEKTYKRLKKYIHQINKIVFAFLASKGLDAVICGTVTTVILLLLGAKYAVLLGLIAGLSNLIPYFGSIVSVFVIGVITLLTGGITKAITAVALLFVFQQIDGNIIEPKILGNSLKVSPLLVIFAVFVAGAYAGIIGMFLAVPIATIIKMLVLEYIEAKEQESKNSQM